MRLSRATDGSNVLCWRSGLEVRLSDLWTGVALLATAMVLAGWAMSIGTTRTGFGDLINAATGTVLTRDETYALWKVRLPRILVGFMAGWSVAIAGAMLQSLARNPLADPGLLGLNQGAMVAILLLLVFAPTVPHALMPLVALAGGIAVALLLIRLTGGDQASGLAILLMGIAIETILSSVSSILLLYASRETSQALAEWMAGSLFHASRAVMVGFAPWFALSLLGIIVTGRSLARYELGEELAAALGEPIARSRPLVLVVAVLLSSASVAMVGPLTFLGVLAPQIVRFITPATARTRLVLCGLVGGTMVIAADGLTRGLTSEMALPIGLALTIIGVPLFIITLRLQALRTMLKDRGKL
jgi:iron complex transport system permease protein